MLNSNWPLLNLYISVYASKVMCFMSRWILFLEAFCDYVTPVHTWHLFQEGAR